MNVPAVRATSKALLGNAYRLEICSALADHVGTSVSAVKLADLLALKYARVHEELKRLEKAGLLRVQDDRLDRRTVGYKVVETVYWNMCTELLAELRGTELATPDIR